MVIGLDCADREVVFGPRGQISPTSSKYSTSLIAGFSSLLPAVEWNGGLGAKSTVWAIHAPLQGTIHPRADGAGGLNKCNVPRQRKQMIEAA